MFRKKIEEIASEADPAAGSPATEWILPHRLDQQVVYFLGNAPDDTPLGRLRVFRAKNLLKHASEAAQRGDTETAYRLFWQAAREDSSNANVLRAIGAASNGEVPIRITQARTTDRQLGWPARTYRVITSPHFEITARCDTAQARQLASQLERVYWIWTQVFFQLWQNETALQKAFSLGPSGTMSRIEPRPNRYRVIVFPNRTAYNETLSPENPGIERSTGFYSNGSRITFLFLGDEADSETRYHELTHQLIGEATRMRVSREVGAKDNFWVVEGIASYMESLRFFETYATVGGWESERLQFARFRVSSLGGSMPLQRLMGQGMQAVQASPDIAAWYTHSAAYSHLLLNDAGRAGFMNYIREVYEARRPAESKLSGELSAAVAVDDGLLRQIRPGTALKSLCIAGTQVTPDAFEALDEQKQMQWFDCAGIPATDAHVVPILQRNSDLRQLRLERTKIGDATFTAIANLKQLRELDLAATPATDQHLRGLDLPQLETLWLTGSLVTDDAIPAILRFPKLKRVDVQSTRITEVGLKRLEDSKPGLQVN